ncbi:hypothetical protein F5Y13DRAFT_187044 [Hypoxylon sp. FL1857]|nr:hypothetical protein F5Y13DRAFT_187044 [Hypoxylon sp. FL1857]
MEEMVKSFQNYQQTFSLAIQIDQTALLLGNDRKLTRIDKKLNLPNLPFAEGTSFDSSREEHNSE